MTEEKDDKHPEMSVDDFIVKWVKVSDSIEALAVVMECEVSNVSADAGVEAGQQREIRYRQITELVADLIVSAGMNFNRPSYADYSWKTDTAKEWWKLWLAVAKFESTPKVEVWQGRGEPWPVMRIHSAPEWYEDPEWQKWLNADGTATWTKRGAEGEDVFFTYCQGEGSDYPGNPENPGIPDRIWQEICLLVEEKHGFNSEVLIWVSNLQ